MQLTKIYFRKCFSISKLRRVIVLYYKHSNFRNKTKLRYTVAILIQTKALVVTWPMYHSGWPSPHQHSQHMSLPRATCRGGVSISVVNPVAKRQLSAHYAIHSGDHAGLPPPRVTWPVIVFLQRTPRLIDFACFGDYHNFSNVWLATPPSHRITRPLGIVEALERPVLLSDHD